MRVCIWHKSTPRPVAGSVRRVLVSTNRLLKECRPALAQRAESGACVHAVLGMPPSGQPATVQIRSRRICPDSASPGPALALLAPRRPVHGPHQQGVFQHPDNPPALTRNASVPGAL